MTLNEAREIVYEVVTQHGPAEAQRLLIARAADDCEFCHAMALHGCDIFEALVKSMTATVH